MINVEKNSIDCLGDDVAELLEVALVGGVEGGKGVAVDVEHGYYFACLAEYWHYDFGPGEAAAGDVAGEEFYIGHYLGLPLFPCCAAHAFSVADAVAGGTALEGSEDEVAGGGVFGAYEVESYPEETECFLDGCCHVGKDAYFFVFVGDEQGGVGKELPVLFFFCHG